MIGGVNSPTASVPPTFQYQSQPRTRWPNSILRTNRSTHRPTQTC